MKTFRILISFFILYSNQAGAQPLSGITDNSLFGLANQESRFLTYQKASCKETDCAIKFIKEFPGDVEALKLARLVLLKQAGLNVFETIDDFALAEKNFSDYTSEDKKRLTGLNFSNQDPNLANTYNASIRTASLRKYLDFYKCGGDKNSPQLDTSAITDMICEGADNNIRCKKKIEYNTLDLAYDPKVPTNICSSTGAQVVPSNALNPLQEVLSVVSAGNLPYHVPSSPFVDVSGNKIQTYLAGKNNDVEIRRIQGQQFLLGNVYKESYFTALLNRAELMARYPGVVGDAEEFPLLTSGKNKDNEKNLNTIINWLKVSETGLCKSNQWLKDRCDDPILDDVRASVASKMLEEIDGGKLKVNQNIPDCRISLACTTQFPLSVPAA